MHNGSHNFILLFITYLSSLKNLPLFSFFFFLTTITTFIISDVPSYNYNSFSVYIHINRNLKFTKIVQHLIYHPSKTLF